MEEKKTRYEILEDCVAVTKGIRHFCCACPEVTRCCEAGFSNELEYYKTTSEETVESLISELAWVRDRKSAHWRGGDLGMYEYMLKMAILHRMGHEANP